MDLTIAWGILISVALFVYMALDGFDLGIGILFPFAKTTQTRDHMMQSIAPIWDTNETWLILAAGGLYGVFPKAYVFIFNALYIPLIGMLICLIFRGVSFEFRFKAPQKLKFIWSFMFFLGSLGAALFQGVILGQLIRGFNTLNGNFDNNYWFWFQDFNFFIAGLVILFYALIGSSFLIYRLQNLDKEHFIFIAKCLLWICICYFALLGITTGYIIYKHPTSELFPTGNYLKDRFLAFYPLYMGLIAITILISIKIYHALTAKTILDGRPFIYNIILLFLVFSGITFLNWPYAVPGVYTIWEAASLPETQKLMFMGTAIFLPLIFGYSIYNFYVFRGKIADQKFYH
jgi:cytochrome d ubiquinol oxidase subunit II